MALDVQLKDAPRAWFLADRGAVFAALSELAGDNANQFRGVVSCWPVGDGSGPAAWRIELNDWNGRSVTAELGHYLLLSGGVLQALSADQYTALTEGA